MIFIDTGPFIGRFLRRDQYHDQALAGWDRLARNREPATTNLWVVNETITYIARHAGNQFAVSTARQIYGAERLEIFRTALEDELQALDIMAKYSDQNVSLVDSISFVQMRNRKIQRAFTFDRHVRVAGFKVWP